MPNISFDIFYNTDLVNFTVSRSGGAPKVKPDWKVRQAPKLAPKPKPTPENTFGKQPPKPSQQKKLPPNTKEVEEIDSDAESTTTQKKEDVKAKKPAAKSTPQTNGNAAKEGEKKKLPKLNKPAQK